MSGLFGNILMVVGRLLLRGLVSRLERGLEFVFELMTGWGWVLCPFCFLRLCRVASCIELSVKVYYVGAGGFVSWDMSYIGGLC